MSICVPFTVFRMHGSATSAVPNQEGALVRIKKVIFYCIFSHSDALKTLISLKEE